MKIYVGCALAYSPEEFKRSVEDFKAKLNKKYEVLEFLGMIKGTEKDVYDWDINNCVAKCDFFIAICDHASLGLGYEIGVAVEKFKKPVLAVAHTNSRVSRLILGVDSPIYEFKRYSQLSDVMYLIDRRISGLNLEAA